MVDLFFGNDQFYCIVTVKKVLISHTLTEIFVEIWKNLFAREYVNRKLQLKFSRVI